MARARPAASPISQDRSQAGGTPSSETTGGTRNPAIPKAERTQKIRGCSSQGCLVITGSIAALTEEIRGAPPGSIAPKLLPEDVGEACSSLHRRECLAARLRAARHIAFNRRRAFEAYRSCRHVSAFGWIFQSRLTIKGQRRVERVRWTVGFDVGAVHSSRLSWK